MNRIAILAPLELGASILSDRVRPRAAKGQGSHVRLLSRQYNSKINPGVIFTANCDVNLWNAGCQRFDVGTIGSPSAQII